MYSPRLNNFRSLNLASMTEIDDGRRILQPAACNRIVADKARPKLRNPASFSSPPILSPKKVKPAKRGSDTGSLDSSIEKPPSPKPISRSPRLLKKKPKSIAANGNQVPTTPIAIVDGVVDYKSISSLLEEHSPGSLAAAQREQAAIMHEKRKMRIAHYGRTAANAERKIVPAEADGQEEKRCSFITQNSDPLYTAYHDEEWGVPVREDNLLFELLVLSGAQVGLDWTTILRKRENFRAAFAGFDAEAVSKLTEKEMALIAEACGIDLARVRGVVDNSKCIIEIKKNFGTLARYLWGFVNNKPLSPVYRSCRKIPAKTSKAESISKDMVRRGFRFVGPTIVHSFMQAAGLTNDHLLSCPRHSKCRLLAAN